MGVKSFSLHTAVPRWARLDVIPFVVLHVLNLCYIIYASKLAPQTPSSSVDLNSNVTADQNITRTQHITKQNEGVAFLGLLLPVLNTAFIPLLLIIQLVTHLGTYWSVEFKALATMKRVDDINEATMVKVKPSKVTEKVGICKLEKLILKLAADKQREEVLSFEFHKRRYIWDADNKKFNKVEFPVHLSFGQYLSTTGYKEPADVEDATNRWGINSFQIPLPSFGELYVEQCRQPFFVFQIACVALWSMDEYWYFSIFTLLMLLLFEGTVVFSRTRNISMLRDMMGRPSKVKVLRGGMWQTMDSDCLLPGDLMSVSRNRLDPEAVVPADLLLLSGKVVVNEAILTGEATPQQKIGVALRDKQEVLSLKRSSDTGDRLYVVFGGTKVLQTVQEPETHPKGIPKPPDNGCVAYVIRNGFNTSQGRLVRTIMFSSEQTTAATKEAGIFVSVLLCFALAAAGYVLKEGWHDPKRNKAKLLLNCSMIIASVVPPELPMNLSLAVNSSLHSLSKLGVFCTEPFRIPFAGKVGVCCFDKTGTLTSEDLILEGVAGMQAPQANAAHSKLDPPANTPDPSVLVLCGCHGLVNIDDSLSGEMMEKVALEAFGWSLSKGDISMENAGRKRKIIVHHRFPFASSLKRMATVVELADRSPTGAATSQFMVLCKGAPETMQDRYVAAPPHFKATYEFYSRQGARVLALGYKELPRQPISQLRSMSRDSAEKELQFAGLVVFRCPNKFESATSLKALKESGHHLVMITGDQVLTACHVARELGMCSNPVSLILTPKSSGLAGGGPGELEWVSPDESERQPFDVKGTRRLSKKYDLCISGETWRSMETEVIDRMMEDVRVFARVSPTQKEQILLSLKAKGHYTLMCGDGTNDVGALKASHVGVALLSGVFNPDDEERRRKQDSVYLNKVGGPTLFDLQLRDAQMANEEITIVRLGDASIASPFTCRQSSIFPITRIIQQGRCTLVTTMQIYKIQALSCLTLAYCLSALYLAGIKLGDQQMMLSAMMTALLFLFMSHAKPLNTLAPVRPPSTICCSYMVFSVLGQFAVHLYVLVKAIEHTNPHVKQGWVCSGDSVNSTKAKEDGLTAPLCSGPCDFIGCNGCIGGTCVSDRDPDSNFSPNILNSVIFIITAIAQVMIFAVNYRGRPYMQSLTEHKPLLYSLIVAVALLVGVCLEVSTDFNAYLMLTPMPSQELKFQILQLMVVDMIGSYVMEVVASFLFYRSACMNVTDMLLRK